MFWNYILSNIVTNTNLSLNKINKNSNQFEKKIKIIFKNINENKYVKNNITEKFLKNYQFKNNLNKTKLNYNYVLSIKNLKKNKQILKNLFFSVFLKKKQTYINVSINNIKILHNTNGILLKKNGIIEKSRKKDPKTSILNLNSSLFFLKNLFLNNKFNIIISVRKIKPFLNKINKILKNELNGKRFVFLLSPEISFNKENFKKIKSIKRRLRKKYNLIDV